MEQILPTMHSSLLNSIFSYIYAKQAAKDIKGQLLLQK